jgi:signal transduction histidine kinase
MQQWMKPAVRWTAAAALTALAVWDAFAVGWAATLPTAAAAASLAAWPHLGRQSAVALLLAATVSLAATAAFGEAATNRAAAWWIAETAVLLALVFLASRTARTRLDTAAVAFGLLAVSLSPLRLGLRMEPPSDPAELVVLVLVWTSAGAAAAGAGRFLHRQRRERERAVDEARRAQRLALARDLHDYVAHDVTGIVVQAQAAQVVGEREPAQALAALARIESAGLQALTSLDRTVVLLREHDARLRDPGAGFADIDALARRFAEANGTSTSLDIDQALAGQPLADATGALAHRIVTEALTNVRRHAPDAAEVRIALRGLPSGLGVEVVNDLRTAPTGERREAGGQGLQQLTRTVHDHGGTLTAGPENGNWRLSAVLPL